MIKTRLKVLLIIIIANCNPITLTGQDDYIVNQAKFLQKSNPSFYGMNQLNRVGVLFNSLKLNETSNMDNKYAFGSIAFLKSEHVKTPSGSSP